MYEGFLSKAKKESFSGEGFLRLLQKLISEEKVLEAMNGISKDLPDTHVEIFDFMKEHFDNEEARENRREVLRKLKQGKESLARYNS